MSQPQMKLSQVSKHFYSSEKAVLNDHFTSQPQGWRDGTCCLILKTGVSFPTLMSRRLPKPVALAPRDLTLSWPLWYPHVPSHTLTQTYAHRCTHTSKITLEYIKS